jgi:hypothetical protein
MPWLADTEVPPPLRERAFALLHKVQQLIHTAA